MSQTTATRASVGSTVISAVLDLWLQPSIDESLEARDAGVDNVPPVSGIDLPVTVPGANAPANP